MQPEDVLQSVAVAAPFFVIAAACYAVAIRKKRRGVGLQGKAHALMERGDDKTAREALLAALWSANEQPAIERRILDDLRQLYARSGVELQTDDYDLLIVQFERLSRKGSHKAWSELKQVQSLKHQLIDRMPKVA